MEKFEKSAGEKKVDEYIERIKNGEDKEVILKDLSPSFVEAIEKGLRENELSELPEEIVFEDNNVSGEEEKIENDNQETVLLAREKLLQSFDDNFSNEKEASFEKYNISLPNLDEVIKNGGGRLDVISNGSVVEFDKLILTIDEKDAEIMFIEKKDKTQNKGIGIDLYIEIGRQLALKGIEFHSSAAQYGPGRNLWMKLAEKGFAEKKGGAFVFKDIENGLDENNNSERYSLFNGAVIETIKHHYKDMLYAYKEVRDMYFNNKNTVSDKTVDMLATMGATKDHMDLMKLTRGDKNYLKQIIDDFVNAFDALDKANKK